MNNNYKTFSMIKYLSKDFYTIEELSCKANISIEEIQQMINSYLIPNYTYKISCSISESSVLLGTLSAEDNNIEFYHNANLNWIERAKVVLTAKNNNYSEASITLKEQMKQRIYDLFLAHKSVFLGFQDLYDEKQNIVTSKFEEQFNFIYQGWCNGTYGICTKNPSDELHIFYKAAYQTLLNYLTECNSKTEYSPEEMQQVVNAANQYDHYVSEFTPLSFEISSRNKFVNKYNHKKIVN